MRAVGYSFECHLTKALSRGIVSAEKLDAILTAVKSGYLRPMVPFTLLGHETCTAQCKVSWTCLVGTQHHLTIAV